MPAAPYSNQLPDSLLKGHKHFLKHDYASNKALFAEHADRQVPKVMWIGCIDSRVPAERILGAELGELFVLRNMANIVPPLAADEASVGAALHFGVDQLEVAHLVVCGHSDCGGIRALTQLGKGRLDPMLSSWVEYAIPALEDCPGDSVDALAKENVISQAEHLLEYPCVERALSEGRLAIHACYYEVGIGKLEQYDPESGTWSYIA